MSNIPGKINGIHTIKSHVADHYVVTFLLHSENLRYDPQFIKIHMNKLLTFNQIMARLSINECINNIFSMTDPDNNNKNNHQRTK